MCAKPSALHMAASITGDRLWSTHHTTTWRLGCRREAEGALRLQLETRTRRRAAALRRQLLQQRGALICRMRRVHGTLGCHRKLVLLADCCLLHLSTNNITICCLPGFSCDIQNLWRLIPRLTQTTAHLPCDAACLPYPACCSGLHSCGAVCLPDDVVLQWWLWRLGSCPDHLQADRYTDCACIKIRWTKSARLATGLRPTQRFYRKIL